jgi:Tol biopolymer transport system component
VSLAPGRRLGPYEIVAPLGAGGMGEVWRARDTRLGRDVAIKVLPEAFARDPDRLARFQREARAVAALSHPHIVALHDIGEEQGTAYVVTELLEGETLRAALRRGPLPVRKSMEQAVQVARGLAAAHEKGIVHRDLKPENVFVTADGQVKILDFGLARWEPIGTPGGTSAETLSRQTTPGTVLGTVGYMSPEQVQGLAGDHRSDVFALGCVLYEMLTGHRAFERPTVAETLTAILREDPPEASASGRTVPPALERTVRRCLEKSPAERFQSARDVAFALEALSGDSRDALSARVGFGRASPRRRLGLSVLALILVAGIAGVTGYFAGLSGQRGGAHLSYTRLTFRQGAIVTARFGPDGRTVFYGAAWEGQPFRVYETRPDGREVVLPLENADLLSVSRDGELAVLLLKTHGGNAWWKAGTLAIVPAAGGAPREVAENVTAADWAPDGKTLAVVRREGTLTRLEFPLGHVIYEKQGWIQFPRVSRSGDAVAFFEGDMQRGWSVGVVERSGRRAVLSAGWDDTWNIVWSPDGRELWFGAPKPCSGTAGALYAVDMQGRRRLLAEGPGSLDLHDITPQGRTLVAGVSLHSTTRGWTRGEERDRDLSWREFSWPVDFSSDGRVVLLNVLSGCAGAAEASPASYLRPVDGRPAVRVGEGFACAISPDGRLVLATAPRSMRVIPVGVGSPRTLDLGFDTSTLAGGVRVLPSGSEMVVAAAETGGQVRLIEVDLQTGAARRSSSPFTPDPNRWLSPPSPDGRVVAAGADGGGVLLVPLDGTAPRRLAGSEANDAPVQWSPDGQTLFVFRPGELPASIFRIDVATGRRTLWKEIHPPDTSATGIGLLFLSQDEKRGVYSYVANQVDLYLVDGLR